jgi:invasion protein IalB
LERHLALAITTVPNSVINPAEAKSKGQPGYLKSVQGEVRMVRSITRRAAFRRESQVVSLAAFVLGVGATLAIAQQGQEVPKTPSKPMTKTQEVPKTPPKPMTKTGSAQRNISAWVKVCTKNEQTNDKQVCLLKYEGLDPRTGDVLVAVVVRTVEGQDKRDLIVTVPTTYSLDMPPGIRIKIDEDEPISLQYVSCTPKSCQAQVELTHQVLDKMRKGNQMLIAAINMQQKPLTFRVLLNGFAITSDGAAVDEIKYRETRARAMELANQPYQPTNQQEGSQQPAMTSPPLSPSPAPQ